MQASVAHILAERAASHPEKTLFTFTGGDGRQRERYTYASFADRVSAVAASLGGAGLARGEPVVLVYPPGLDMAVAFFACAWIGAIPAPAPPPRGKSHGWSRLAHIASDAGARFGLTVAALGDRAEQVGPGGKGSPGALRWIATDRLDCESTIPSPSPHEILFIQYTSGSTSSPRGVAVTHANVMHNARLCVEHEQPVGVSWLPHFHDMGLLGYFLFSLVRNGEAHCFSPADFLRRPVLWFELITRVGATITTAPNAGYEYCLRPDRISDDDLRGIDLSSLRTMVNCSEPVRPATVERFLDRFAPRGLDRGAYVAGYGLAEHTLCVTTGGRRIVERTATAPADGQAPFPAGERSASCGAPAHDVDLRIVDPATGREVTAGGTGEIWVDSPSKAAGYWRQPDLTRDRFQAALAGGTGGRTYLRTGDLGFLSDGELHVCGRIREMLVLSGRNVFPADVEAVIESAFAGLAGRVVGFGMADAAAGTEGLVVLVEAAAEQPDLAAIRDAIEAAMGIVVGTIARVPRGTIVRTSSGKLARALCRAGWEHGSVEPIEVLHPSAADDEIGSLLEMLRRRALALGNADATLDELGLDSITFVTLSLALDRLLGEHGLASPALLDQVADLSLLQALRGSDLVAALAALRAGTIRADAVAGLLDAAARRIRDDERARMRADAEAPIARPVTPARAAASGGTFVTGATGFLGAHLLRSLIELGDEPVFVLVRGADRAAAGARLRRALLDTDMGAGQVEAAMRSRLTIHCGDLTRPRLGLAEAEFGRLAEATGRVYHCGAEVDYVKSYNLLRAANVAATREVLALAAAGRPKALHHISTTFIYGWSTKPFLREADDNPAMENLDFGYAQSKWVAEQLVLRAAAAGLAARIYRPSLVTASATGRFVRRDIVVRVLGHMIRHGLTVDATNQVSFVPVDVCARNIVALSRDDATPPVVHMTADDYHTIGDICAVITERFGYPFREVGLEDFVAHAHAHCGPEDELFPLLSFLDRNTPRILRMGHKRYDSSGYRAARDGNPLAVRHPDLAATLDPIVAFLRGEGLVPPPPPALRTALTGRRTGARPAEMTT